MGTLLLHGAIPLRGLSHDAEGKGRFGKCAARRHFDSHAPGAEEDIVSSSPLTYGHRLLGISGDRREKPHALSRRGDRHCRKDGRISGRSPVQMEYRSDVASRKLRFDRIRRPEEPAFECGRERLDRPERTLLQRPHRPLQPGGVVPLHGFCTEGGGNVRRAGKECDDQRHTCVQFFDRPGAGKSGNQVPLKRPQLRPVAPRRRRQDRIRAEDLGGQAFLLGIGFGTGHGPLLDGGAGLFLVSRIEHGGTRSSAVFGNIRLRPGAGFPQVSLRHGAGALYRRRGQRPA